MGPPLPSGLDLRSLNRETLLQQFLQSIQSFHLVWNVGIEHPQIVKRLYDGRLRIFVSTEGALIASNQEPPAVTFHLHQMAEEALLKLDNLLRVGNPFRRA